MTRGIAPNFSGQRFGKLTVIDRRGSDPQGNALWSCKCDCGNEALVRAAFLKRGQQFCTKQCPFHREHARMHLEGRRFGRLTAVEFVRMSERGGKALWRFSCVCGSLIERVADQVLMGFTRSCGCLTNEDYAAPYSGESKALFHKWKRRAAELHRTPAWLTDEHWRQIEDIYDQARKLSDETGIFHHVDHIVPLKGKTVSGLHVPWNLRPLPAKENIRKNARLLDDVC